MLFRFKKAPSGSAKDVLSICIGRDFRASNADSHFYAVLLPFRHGTRLDKTAYVFRNCTCLLYAHVA